MKVILLNELKGKGSEGDVVEVARGYAVNYLFPNKIAVEATSGNVKQLEARRHNIEKREASRKAEAEALAAAAAGKAVFVEAKVGDEGRLYGSITGQMIADAIIAQLGVDADRRKIDVHGHIKTVGDHVVTVALHRDVKVDVTVTVVPEGGEHVAAEAPAAQAAAEVVDEPEADDAEDEADELEDAEDNE